MPMGHFSRLAGAVALAVIVIPVMVRTTEDMLMLIPNTLREAAAALGVPRSLMIRQVAYRAAQRRHHHRRAARRSRASAAKPRHCSSPRSTTSFAAPISTRRWRACPSVIFQFALSPYEDWQDLAWAGALLITLAVLALSIVARALTGTRKAS